MNSTMKPTPGAWELSGNPANGCFVFVREGDAASDPDVIVAEAHGLDINIVMPADIANRSRKILAEIMPLADQATWHQQYANGRLMAMAPEMLRILKMVRDKVDLSEEMRFWVTNTLIGADDEEATGPDDPAHIAYMMKLSRGEV